MARADHSSLHARQTFDDTLQFRSTFSKNEQFRAVSERTFPTPKYDLFLPQGVASARTESRSIPLVQNARQRASSTQSSCASVNPRDGSGRTDRLSKSSTPTPLSRHFPATARYSETIPRSKSSTSLLPAHLRPTAVREEDSLSAERYASSLRLLATWESIALKYADIDPEDDAEIDIATGRIVRGKEKIAEMPDRVIGGMSDEEEAEEFRRKGKFSVKNVDSTSQAPSAVDMVERFIPPVLPLTVDPAGDFSDKDELDAWNDDELEIQVEALPPSHLSESRHSRPWTAEDDLDLREFLKAEERRKAMFGEEDAVEEAEIEEESRSQPGKVLDKEEAMSRRTVHASVPYFSTDNSAPLSRSSSRSIGTDSLLKAASSFAQSTSRRCVLAEAQVDSEDEISAEDELAGMLETPNRSQELDASRRAINAGSSSLILDMLNVRNARPSSPSSASSHLNRQSTEGLSSSCEGDIMPRSHRLRWSRRTPDLDEEDLCDEQLLHMSSQDKDHELEDDPLTDGIVHTGKPVVSGKAEASPDKGRCLSDKVVEVVIEVAANDGSVSESRDPGTEQSATGNPPRRSSRQSAQGKSYVLRRKRNSKPSLRRESTPSEFDHVAVGRVDSTDHWPKISSAHRPVPLLLPLDFDDGYESSASRSPDILQEVNLPQSPSRSPSVVEGTPEPYAFDDSEDVNHRSVNMSVVRGLSSEEHISEDSHDSSDGAIGLVVAQSPSKYILHLPYEDPPLQALAGHFSEELHVPPTPLTARTAYLDLRASVDMGSAKPCSVGIEEDIGRATSLSLNTSQDEDEDDILLLGATFEDEEEIIWPESKPVLTQPDEPHAESGWPNTSCEMSFKSIKGEKQELTTFTAPFRCSRIIDLTVDDLCDEGEHDELDEW
ncbi:hypothetical protein NliqN6_4901 [Naganishia liquefaciens]|uniref:Uncharacterized protein n=1 Tax=Naganishia liquefaciens TaxID=104408 RepID=A0A8H3TWR2_9TREE|nr:hypothetical protein NliqN6_4901 [Naganishia liquefaciens]